jgi:hypothetical protein
MNSGAVATQDEAEAVYGVKVEDRWLGSLKGVNGIRQVLTLRVKEGLPP